MTAFKIAAVAAAATALLSNAALADRDATPGERAHVSDILRSAGFTSFEDVDYDKGVFEVDDARHVDGKVYDVDIRDGAIIKQKLD